MLCMTLPVRNEEDILQLCLQFHLERGVDHIIAIDNLSEDGSREILEAFAKTGQLTLLESDSENYDQPGWVKRMTEEASKLGADWVFHNDADEFWYSETPLKEILQSIPKETIAVSVERWNYVPVDELPWYKTHIYRDNESLNTFGKRILPKIGVKPLPQITTRAGNHKAFIDNKQVLAPLIPEIEIFHFPIRGYKQFERKVEIGGRAYGSNPGLWQKTPIIELYRHFQSGTLRSYYEQQLISSHENQERLKKGLIEQDLRFYNAISPFLKNCLS